MYVDIYIYIIGRADLALTRNYMPAPLTSSVCDVAYIFGRTVRENKSSERGLREQPGLSRGIVTKMCFLFFLFGNKGYWLRGSLLALGQL